MNQKGEFMVTKAELKILEKAFTAEIDKTYFQSKSQLTKKLINEGFLEEHQISQSGVGGILNFNYLRLTIKGHYTYCSSCKDVDIDV